MKSFISAIAVAAVLATPVVSFAQSNGPVTRAQVRAELAQVQKAERGATLWNTGDAHYPDGLAAAESQVVAQNGASQATGYGPATNGTSQSGHAQVPGQVPQADAGGNDWLKATTSSNHP
ncbi:DUF4148 domain-containing protein [Paraburkholderia sp. 2C]